MAIITVNGARRDVQVPNDTPLLYCPAKRSRTVRTAVRLRTRSVRSLFGPARRQGNPFLHNTRLGVRPARKSPHSKGSPQGGRSRRACRRRRRRKRSTPFKHAWIEEQTPLCGFCQNGMMIKATELLERVASPTVAEIKEAFTTSGPSAHLCRCGSYTAIIEAVQRAATVTGKGR